MDENGELYITGRLNDLIIVDGRNVYPQDLERAAEQSHPAVRHGCTAAFPTIAEGSERAVLVAEVKVSGKKGAAQPDPWGIIEAICSSVVADCDVALHTVVLAPVGAIPKGTSGKLQRRACRELFERGELETVWATSAMQGGVKEDASVPALLRTLEQPMRTWSPTLPLKANGEVDRQALSKQLWQESGAVAAQTAEPLGGLSNLSAADLTEVVSRVAAEIFEIPNLRAETLFVELGADSLLALRFRDRLERVLDHPLPATLIYDYPSVAAIVRALVPSIEVASPTVRTDATEPVAIVGMACRAPGGVENVEGYWSLLEEGRDVVSEFPARWDALALYDPDPEAEGKSYAREGDFCAMWTCSTRLFLASRRGKRW